MSPEPVLRFRQQWLDADWEDEVLHCTKCGTPTVRRRLRIDGYAPSDGTPYVYALRVCPNRRIIFDRHTSEWVHAWPTGGEPDPRRITSYG